MTWHCNFKLDTRSLCSFCTGLPACLTGHAGLSAAVGTAPVHTSRRVHVLPLGTVQRVHLMLGTRSQISPLPTARISKRMITGQ